MPWISTRRSHPVRYQQLYWRLWTYLSDHGQFHPFRDAQQQWRIHPRRFFWRKSYSFSFRLHQRNEIVIEEHWFHNLFNALVLSYTRLPSNGYFGEFFTKIPRRYKTTFLERVEPFSTKKATSPEEGTSSPVDEGAPIKINELEDEDESDIFIGDSNFFVNENKRKLESPLPKVATLLLRKLQLELFEDFEDFEQCLNVFD